jgi:hypothetical protein
MSPANRSDHAAASVEALPFLYFTGREPLKEPWPQTEAIRPLVTKDMPYWDTVLRRISRKFGVSITEAEAMLVTALRDPRQLLLGVYIRHNGLYRVRRSPWAES